MVVAPARHALLRQRSELREKVRAVRDKWRENLFEYVPVVLAEQAQVFADFVADGFDLAPGEVALRLDGFVRLLQPDERPQRREEAPAKVDVAVGRREAVGVRTADGPEERVRHAGVAPRAKCREIEIVGDVCRRHLLSALLRRAAISNRFARSVSGFSGNFVAANAS